MMMTKGEDSLPDDLAGRRPLRVIDGPSLSGHNHHRHDDGHDNHEDHDGDGYHNKEPTVMWSLRLYLLRDIVFIALPNLLSVQILSMLFYIILLTNGIQ